MLKLMDAASYSSGKPPSKARRGLLREPRPGGRPAPQAVSGSGEDLFFLIFAGREMLRGARY
jgi:hypothetical protein